MTTETRPVSENSIVRHYRGATRQEAQIAYLADALKAARADYVAVDQAWTEDEHGLLLAVTYAGPEPHAPAKPVEAETDTVPEPELESTPVVESAAPEPTGIDAPAATPESAPAPEPIAEAEPAATAAPVAAPTSRTYQPVQRIQPIQSTAPATAAVAEMNGSARAEPAAAAEQPAAPDEPAAAPTPVETAEPEPMPASEPASEAMTAAASEPVSDAEPVSAAEPTPHAKPMPEPVPEVLGRQVKLTVQTMELHTAGEPLRLIRSGFPDVPVLPVLERRQWVKENADHVRRSLMFEPRGHKDMYGAVLLPPYSDFADMTVLFMHNEGWSTMCGHGVIAITTGLIEDGLFPATEPVTTIRYETPAGLVAANAATVKLEDGSWAVRGVRFTNVPSYLAAQSLSVKPDGVELHAMAKQYGALEVDLAFGGAYYGIVNAAEVGLRVVPEQAEELRRVGSAITDVLRRDHTPAHPTDPDLGFVYGTIIVDLEPRTSPDGKAREAHIRNATIFADAELDRSPCGSGTSAILAQLHARGRIHAGQEIINAGITGEHFLGRVESETTLGPYAAVNTSVAGTAYVSGYSTFVVDGRDPLGEGFLLE
jgi:trans-L-3-hydroxyproline dehydratase